MERHQHPRVMYYRTHSTQAIDEAHLSPDDPKIAIHCTNLGHYFAAKTEFAEALEYYRRVRQQQGGYYFMIMVAF
jgi:hypothetical protein